MRALTVQQKEKYQGDDWWEWALWIEGPAAMLNMIEHVTYKLHPTFRDPVREVRDRKSKFKLESAGWGVFRVAIVVHFKDGSTETLYHNLELHYPDGTATLA